MRPLLLGNGTQIYLLYQYVQQCTKKLTQKELQQGRAREDVFALLALLVQKYKVLTLRAAFQGFLGPERTIIDELNLAQDNRSNIRYKSAHSTKVHILTQLLVPKYKY